MSSLSEAAASSGAPATPRPKTVTGLDGKTYTKKRPSKEEIAQRERTVKEFLVLHPDAPRNEVVRKTGIDKSWVTNWARRNGHSWEAAGPSHSAVSSGGRKRHNLEKSPVVLTPDEYGEDIDEGEPEPRIVLLIDTIKRDLQELKKYEEEEVLLACTKEEWAEMVAWPW